MARLSRAVQHINASGDLDAILRDMLAIARELTGALRGVITTVDQDGSVMEFADSGFGPVERDQVAAWIENPQLFARFRDVDGVLSFEELPPAALSHVSPVGIEDLNAFQGTKLHHHGSHVGNLLLLGKEGDEKFTREDEGFLGMIASQGAAAIAHLHTRRDAQQARADLKALVDISPIGVLVLDARLGTVELLNRESMRLVEVLRSPERTIQQLLNELTVRRVDGQEFKFEEVAVPQVLGHAETVRGEEIEISVRDGRSVRLLLYCTPIRDADGQVEKVIVIIQDVAPIQELERLRVRAELIGVVSHELRAPLTSIKGSAAIALGASVEPDRAEIHQIFRIIDAQADHMRRLINDLLDVRRIDMGTLAVTPRPLEVTDLVEEARKTFLSGEKKRTVLIEVPMELPKVMADRLRIIQVLNNLLSNAAKHSPDHSPIRLTAKREHSHVAISVVDEGAGIAPELRSKLFHAQAGNVEEREAGKEGLGFGLIICKGVVEAHEGRIWVESDGENRGAKFTFTLPFAREEVGTIEAPRATDESEAPSPKSRNQKRILVVDDDPNMLRFTKNALKLAGYIPIVTGSDSELPAIIKKEKPDLVLLDLMLPGADGIELLDTVPELAELPVIFISGYGKSETIAQALDAGAIDYIVKPFSVTELTARIRAAIRRRVDPEAFKLKDLTINYEERRVTLADRPLQLTATEYELLRVLSSKPGSIFTYNSLSRQVWAGRYSGQPNLVRSYIMKLRRKLGEDPATPKYIFNVHGVGYKMPKLCIPVKSSS